MKRLTNKESEIMEFFWQSGPMFVKDLVALYPDPKPHFNTISTMVRILESNGYLSHNVYGSTYQYYSVVSKEEYGKNAISSMVSNFFDGSYLDAVSALVKEEKISIDELKELINKVNSSSK
ncbi:MAG: BlaI/MecI/CopY family transcriptional regulator [Bacteroidales bacterium]|nr:BlaI/MecI/CopY family transcriptional regulator [Eubacteriales bacterium]MDD4669975.1 BlaI/MecI/CopY family transcriptional regulator [Bacteroidales bacterium]